jgi:putative methyltransferase (TIGR04325 family)
MSRTRTVVRNLLPRVVVQAVRRARGVRLTTGFHGDFQTWADAAAEAGGYYDPSILDKTATAAAKVKNGTAAFERDSVLFDEIQYSWPVLAGLLWAASSGGNELNVLDFGGSLGTSYFQNRGFLQHVARLRWNIVEQVHYVARGRAEFETPVLRFYESVDSCLSETEPNTILVSGSLGYVEQPYALLDQLVGLECPYLIFDRIGFLPDRDRITVQRVPEHVYKASYPAWFLSEKRFRSVLDARYTLMAGFDALEGLIDLGDVVGHSKGFIFRARSA